MSALSARFKLKLPMVACLNTSRDGTRDPDASPAQRYEFSEWKWVTVHPDYHVALEGHYYSAPCQLVRQRVELRLTAACVEI